MLPARECVCPLQFHVFLMIVLVFVQDTVDVTITQPLTPADVIVVHATGAATNIPADDPRLVKVHVPVHTHLPVSLLSHLCVCRDVTVLLQITPTLTPDDAAYLARQLNGTGATKTDVPCGEKPRVCAVNVTCPPVTTAGPHRVLLYTPVSPCVAAFDSRVELTDPDAIAAVKEGCPTVQGYVLAAASQRFTVQAGRTAAVPVGAAPDPLTLAAVGGAAAGSIGSNIALVQVCSQQSLCQRVLTWSFAGESLSIVSLQACLALYRLLFVKSGVTEGVEAQLAALEQQFTTLPAAALQVILATVQQQLTS